MSITDNAADNVDRTRDTTPFQHILVPTDFGDPANRALDLALGLASKFGAKLTLLHSVGGQATAPMEGLVWPTEALLTAAQGELDDALARTRARHPNTAGVLATAEPWRAILDAASGCAADLIVMGTHGRRGLANVLLGSVAGKVVRLSPVPVLTVPCGAERQE